jgi:hypothetical protein
MTEETPDTPKKRFAPPIHPLLFAVFPMLSLYVQNIDQVPLAQVWRPVAYALAGTLALWLILVLLFRNVRKAAIASSAIVLAVLSYKHIAHFVPASFEWLLGPLGIVLIACAIVLLINTKKPLYDLTAVLNVASLFLFASVSWSIGAAFWKSSRPGDHSGEKVPIAPVGEAEVKAIKSKRVYGKVTAETAKLPDIYYIILDAYGRADTLKAFYGYDNTPFIRELEKRGFYVPPRSRANYDETPLCLASSLNYTYLDELAKRVGPQGSLEACRKMLDDNAVIAHLSKFGYRYVSIGSGVGQARVDTADVSLNEQAEVQLFSEEVNPITLKPDSEVYHAQYDRHRKRLLGVLDNLDTVAALPFKKFVFAHLLAPHPPFVFGSNGEPAYQRGGISFADASWLVSDTSRDWYKHRYIAQLEYVNKRTLQALDAILKQSKTPPIIIVQGDHGSRMNLDWESLARTDVREPFSILNAYFVPKRVRARLYDTISPVNSFRVILSELFDAKLPLLPDRSYYSTADEPYKFFDVTEQSKQPLTGAAAHGAPPSAGAPVRTGPASETKPVSAGTAGVGFAN